MITERTLKEWRREALKEREVKLTQTDPQVSIDFINAKCKTQSERIIRMTQELLDEHLTRTIK